jgi:hypothetical protein
MTRLPLALIALTGVVLLTGPARAADPSDGVAFFEKTIRPVLAERCFACHSAQSGKSKGGLRLDTPRALLQGGDSGSAVVPGKPDQSRLIRAVRYTADDLHMPPKDKERLSAGQVRDLETWVRIGAPVPKDGGGRKVDAGSHWSFQPVREPALPPVRGSAHPIDRFVDAGLAAHGLTPVGPADKRTLIRRVTFDLTGLPPTPEEVEAFVTDTSPDAFARVVDRLLASPAYGEKWGRHWLDAVRYADTCGDNSDFPVAEAYKYRDYVIDSFNRDKPYDRFAREQLAGDLLPAATEAQRREQVIATGYLATARRFGSTATEHHLTLEDVIDNFGKTFLGLSVSCGRCHDHKFDPVPQTDYYALYGIFASTTFAFPGTELYRFPKDFVALGTPDEARERRRWEQEVAELSDRHEKLKNDRKRVQQAPDGKLNGRTVAQVEAEFAAVNARLAELEDHVPTVEVAYAVGEGTPANARVHKKGDPKLLGDEVPRGWLRVLGGQRIPPAEKGSGRLELAQWLTDANNPLFARVMVNRIWQGHFGQGIVATPNDFGARGEKPTHPELLDFLARRFAEGGWSVKAMHRLIVTSQAYQRASTDDPAGLQRDNRNEYLWHFARQRLSAEEIRDAMLAVSGSLDRTPGRGHPFPPKKEWTFTQHKPFVAAYDHDRRSVYLMQQRLRKQPFLEVFDGADPNAATGLRPLSTTPLQALFLMNDPFVHAQADRFAARVLRDRSDEAARIDEAYRLAFGRPPEADEIETGQAYLRAVAGKVREAGTTADRLPRAAWASYARVLLGSNEFLFVE